MSGHSALPSLILASASPRRRELLSDLGWSFVVQPPSVDEEIAEGELPGEAVERLARLKALAVAKGSPETPVIAADTVVVVEGTILGKPRDRDDGLAMIRLLAGRSHEVFSGVALAWRGELLSASERTEVTFRPLSESEVRAYVDRGEGDDKAGSYAIQGSGALLIDSIQGCYFNVVGLPLARLSRLMAEAGLTLERQWRFGAR